MTGRSADKTARAVAERFGVAASDARRLVRTESCYVANQAEMDSYKECGVEKYEFVAALDARTSQICRDMDGKVFPVEEQSPGTNAPPMHPYCRSTTIAVFDDEVTEGLQRRARDPVTGKNELIPADMTYWEWEKWINEKYGAGTLDIERKKIKNHETDKKLHEKYKAIFGNNIPKSFAKFQELKYNNADEWTNLKSIKQQTINAMDFVDMDRLVGKLGNKETRLWYKTKDEKIPTLLDENLSSKEKAMQAVELRNTFRTQARDLMADQEKRKELDEKYPNKSFEELVEHKRKKYGMTDEEAYQDIIRSSQTTNSDFDQKAGIQKGDKE